MIHQNLQKKQGNKIGHTIGLTIIGLHCDRKKACCLHFEIDNNAFYFLKCNKISQSADLIIIVVSEWQEMKIRRLTDEYLVKVQLNVY